MSLLRSNNANFEITIPWLINKGWTVYSAEFSPPMMRLKPPFPVEDNLHLNVYINQYAIGNENPRICWISIIRNCDGGVLSTKLDISDKQMMKFLFFDEHPQIK